MMEENDTIPYAKQWIDEEDIEAVGATLRSAYIARGPKVEEFERALCAVVGALHGVALTSGTAGLHIACLAAGVQSGDEVITSPLTFVASANCAAYCGAIPVFADIDTKTYNIDPREIEKKLTPRTKAVIPVHFAGQSCDMEAIVSVVRAAEQRFKKKIWIIEDACHVLTSRYRGKSVGSCTYGDMSVMSFHPVKHITSGEGGVVFTNDPAVADQLRRLRGHGITRDPKLFSQNPGPWYHEQIDLGYNYFLTDIQCALGLSQLKKLPQFAARRRSIVTRYNDAFAAERFVTTPYEAPECESVYHIYVLQVDFAALGVSRASCMEYLKSRGILTQVHYIPVHMQPFYTRTFGFGKGDYPITESYYERTLSLPLFPKMTDDDVERVVTAVKDFLRDRISHT